MPRKSSTNTAALSTAIKNIKKEMNPYISVKGGTASGILSQTYIDRVSQSEFTMVGSTLEVKQSSLASIIPDGAKILDMKIHNINGRKIAVRIPAGSKLILTNGDPATGSNKEINKVAYAPLSRFPKLKVEIPDLVSTFIDTGSADSSSLFALITDGPTDKVVVRFHYKITV
jgi:hypothetical protein